MRCFFYLVPLVSSSFFFFLFFFVCLILFFIFWERVSWNPDWPQICYETKAVPEPDTPASPLCCWDYMEEPAHPAWPFHLVFTSCSFFLDGIPRPLPRLATPNCPSDLCLRNHSFSFVSWYYRRTRSYYLLHYELYLPGFPHHRQ